MSQVIIVHPGSTVSFSYQPQTLWEALSISPSIGLLVHLSIRVEKWKNKQSKCFCVGVWVGVWMGVGCLCLKQRNTCREWNKPKRCPEKKKGNQPDKTQSQKIPKPRTYDFFPTARAAFIGKLSIVLLIICKALKRWNNDVIIAWITLDHEIMDHDWMTHGRDATCVFSLIFLVKAQDFLVACYAQHRK